MHPSFLQPLKWGSDTFPFCRPVTGQILEALHTDPASSVSLEKEKNSKVLPPIRYLMLSAVV